jgi:cytochrome b involved in lipid metabolism
MVKYFTASEVAAHNSADDIWVSFLGGVYDITPLAQKHTGASAMLVACSLHLLCLQAMCF